MDIDNISNTIDVLMLELLKRTERYSEGCFFFPMLGSCTTLLGYFHGLFDLVAEVL